MIPALLLLLMLAAPVSVAAEAPAAAVDQDAAVDSAIRFIRARLLARASRPVETTVDPLMIDTPTGPVWQIPLRFTSPRFGQPEEATLYVDALSGQVIEAARRVEPLITRGNPDHLERLEAALAKHPVDQRAYRVWADYFSYRGNERQVQMHEERTAALSIFEPDGKSQYRLVFVSPRTIDEVRVFTALMPRDGSIISIGRLCHPGPAAANDSIVDQVEITPTPVREFAHDNGALKRLSCGENTSVFAIVLELNHRDAARIREVAEGLLAMVPIVTTWSYQPVSP